MKNTFFFRWWTRSALFVTQTHLAFPHERHLSTHIDKKCRIFGVFLCSIILKKDKCNIRVIKKKKKKKWPKRLRQNSCEKNPTVFCCFLFLSVGGKFNGSSLLLLWLSCVFPTFVMKATCRLICLFFFRLQYSPLLLLSFHLFNTRDTKRFFFCEEIKRGLAQHPPDWRKTQLAESRDP